MHFSHIILVNYLWSFPKCLQITGKSVFYQSKVLLRPLTKAEHKIKKTLLNSRTRTITPHYWKNTMTKQIDGHMKRFGKKTAVWRICAPVSCFLCVVFHKFALHPVEDYPTHCMQKTNSSKGKLIMEKSKTTK